MSANDSQNERHIQYVKKIYSDSEAICDDKQTVQPVETKDAETHKGIELRTVLQTCQAFQEFYPDAITSWEDLIGVADKIAPMIGVDGPVWQQAGQIMGYRRAAIVVLYILENLDTIHNPGGYLRHLTKTARAGGVDVAPLLAALGTRGGIVS
jgi:replication initiation protein RepC